DGYRQYYQQASDPAAARAFLHARISHLQSVIFAAEKAEAGALAGFVQLYPSFSSVKMKRLWVLNDLFVSPDFRRQGVARLLMQAATEWARASEAAGLMLETEVSNTKAQALYESLGYEKSVAYHTYYLNT
ncbi:MAG: GNAT family N-acetyltransferase, partial [Bacteroidota bacterium]